LFFGTDYNWRLEPETSGNSRAIADIGSHLMDIIEYVTGLNTIEVFADFNIIHKTRKKPLKAVATYSGKMLQAEDYADVPITTEDHANVLLRFDNGNRGSITVSQVSAGRKNQLRLEISGSKKTFAWNSEAPNTVWIGSRNSYNEVLMRDPSLAYPEASAIMTFPGETIMKAFRIRQSTYVRKCTRLLRQENNPKARPSLLLQMATVNY
jgi:predicted dehydrogenase